MDLLCRNHCTVPRLQRKLPSLLLVAGLAASGAVFAQTFRALDGADAWPANNHPNWAYGSTPTLGGLFAPFQSAHSRTGYYTMNAYQFSSGAYPANYPIIAFNTTTNEITYNSGQFVVPGEAVDLVPGNSGTYAVCRFRVPAAGVYTVRGKFRGLEGPYGAVPATRTDVHVLRNSGSLFDEMVIGQFTEKSFDSTLHLEPGDTLDFAVGYGTGYYGNQDDSTGLFATITRMPELSIEPTFPGGVLVSWPLGATAYRLETATDLASGSWEAVTNAVAGDGVRNTVSLDKPDTVRFFRLKSGH